MAVTQALTLPIKIGLGLLVAIALGVPMLATWQALAFAAAVLAIVFGSLRPGLWRIAAAAAIVAAAAGASGLLPRADIAEAHNPFLVINRGEALERGLPPQAFASWKAQFDALYPPDHEPYQPRSMWRQYGGVPPVLYTRSSDAIWRPAKYTRQVDAIGFTTLGEFRAGFANQPQYNFWAGELRRETMPFYVMYELTPASVGSALAWKGQAFWERGDGTFEEIVHPDIAERTITAADNGRRVYAAFFPQRDGSLYFALRPSMTLRLAAWLRAGIALAAVFAALALSIRPRWPSYLRATAIFAIAYVLMTGFLAVSAGKYLGATYPPQGGGDDGMTHDGVGRAMAMLVGEGRFLEALKGSELVYWSTPGTRYVRMVEKLLFGDTNHLFALIIACVPIVIFYLMRHFLGTRRGLALTAVFCLLVVGNFCYLQYIYNAKLGYGDAIACGAFLLGLTLLLRAEPAWGGDHGNGGGALWMAGAALALSMFIRPNFAIAVVWLGGAFGLAAIRRRDLIAPAVLAAGLALALWMPFHNWYYGGEFYLISKSGATVSVTLGPRDYVTALADATRGRLHTAAVDATTKQIAGWLAGPGWVVKPAVTPLGWVSHYANLVGLFVACWVAFGWMRRGFRAPHALPVVAVTCLAAQLPMLFVFATQQRYAMLGWDLSLIVLIVFVLDKSWSVSRAELSQPRALPV